jgi:hypothetical protein
MATPPLISVWHWQLDLTWALLDGHHGSRLQPRNSAAFE